jgi:two-component system chemotaxis response regulator CheB
VGLVASAGGQGALAEVLSTLPPDFPAPIVAVQHMSPEHPSPLASLLDRRTALEVREAGQGEELKPGRVYLPRPNRHLLAGAGMLFHSRTDRVSSCRPSIDRFLESVALAYAERALVVVLTGGGIDGLDGLRLLRLLRAAVLIQDPQTARVPLLPQAALRSGSADLVLSLESIAPALVSLVTVPGAAALFGLSKNRCSPEREYDTEVAPALRRHQSHPSFPLHRL